MGLPESPDPSGHFHGRVHAAEGGVPHRLRGQVAPRHPNATKDGRNQGLENVDYSLPLEIGPNDYGFDYSFILPGSLDMYPYVFAKQGHFQGDVTARKGWSAFNRVGPAAAGLRGLQGARHVRIGGGELHRT